MNRKEFLDNIKRYIEVGEMSFLIGAGFSRNVNNNAYPFWGELLEDAAWNLYGDSGKATKAKKQKEGGRGQVSDTRTGIRVSV